MRRHRLLSLLIATGCDFSGHVAADATATATDTGSDSGARDAGWPLRAPIAYWSFDVDARDAHGVHHGTLRGGASITSGARGFGGGEALLLTAEGDRVDVQNPTTFDFNTDFTWHAYITTASVAGAIFSRNPTTTG